MPLGTARPNAAAPVLVLAADDFGPELSSALVVEEARRWPRSPPELPSESVFVRAMEGDLESEDSLE